MFLNVMYGYFMMIELKWCLGYVNIYLGEKII